MYDKEQIEQFHKNTIEDYNNSLIVEDIVKVNLIEKTDGSFVQIGIRPIIKEDMFVYKNWHPSLPSIGMDVANGERDFLIKNILDNKNVKRIIFNKKEISDFPKHAYDFNKATILISLDFFMGLHKEFVRRIEYKDHKTILDYNYNLVFVPGEIMSGKMIIISEDAILWEKEKFPNEFTEKDEKVDVRVVPAKQFGKVDITIRSVNKIKRFDPKLIKILEVREKPKGERIDG
ncbi:MAG: hypothetical protein KKC19_00800 [Nanoarchaeota archaeon]|nr:hypothetical protein [Nanoarchaeota archaeon]